MDDNERMKAIASPKFQELAEKMEEFSEKSDENNEHMKANNVLLSRLCDLKEDQADGEQNFRNDWALYKKRSGRTTHVLLVIAILALTFDVVKSGDAVELIDRATSLCFQANTTISEFLCPFTPF